MSFGKQRPGDWMCPNCNFLIWASKSSCNKCGAVKPNKQFGSGRRPGDWMCRNCNFLIWGSKHSCMKCGATKPNKGHVGNIINKHQNYNPNEQKHNGSNNNSQRKQQQFKYLVVLDFEATCDENKKIYPQEIIEWPAMIIDTSTNTILTKKTFHFYIKPKHNPKLTSFCTQLTGITQSFLDKHGCNNTVTSVLKQWNTWCIKNNLLPKMSNNNQPIPIAAIVTCGDWDLKTMWSDQQATTQCSCPLLFHSWINIKQIFKNSTRTFGNKKNQYGMGMMGMIKYLGIKHEGRHHSGIDDVYNICKIAQKLLKNGVSFDYTTINFRKRNIWNDIRQPTIKQVEQKDEIKKLSRPKKQTFRYLVVLDFEATCDKPKNPDPQEIIEWPAMIIDTMTNKLLNVKPFHYYIKPKIHPKLSKFCTNLTGITQDIMDNEGALNTIESVVDAWNEWCFQNNLLCCNENKPNACIVTHFDWDLQKCWTMQQAVVKCIQPVLFHSWIDICVPIYKNLDKFNCEANNYGRNRFKRGFKKLVKYLGIEHEGRHHSGIDDVRNICKIVQKCLDVGVVFHYTTRNYKGRHIKNDVICFHKKQSKNQDDNHENNQVIKK